MTVRDLIKRLEREDPDGIIAVYGTTDDDGSGTIYVESPGLERHVEVVA